MKVYYNDRGFQLGNLLFVLMQAHKDRLVGIEESYVLRTGYFKFAQSFFPDYLEKHKVVNLNHLAITKYQDKTMMQRYWTHSAENIF